MERVKRAAVLDLVRLQVADHVEAHGTRLLDELETLYEEADLD